MKEFWNLIQGVITALGGWIGYYLGGCDVLLVALAVFVTADYITGVLCAITDHQLNSEVGFKGIARKILIFILVSISNVIDAEVLKGGAVIRTATIFFLSLQ